MGYRGGGLYRISGDSVEGYTASDGLPGNTVLALFEDREGSLWVGTDGGGLIQFTDSRILAYGSPRIPLGVPVSCVAEDGTGGYWIGTRGAPFRGLAHLTRGGLEFLMNPSLVWSPGILSIHRREPGTLWLGCEELGLYLLRDGVLVQGPPLPFESRNVLCFAQRGGGDLLLGTSAGLFELNAGGSKPRPVPGTEKLVVQTILVTGDVLWLGTISGLYALSPRGSKKWSLGENLISDNVRALWRDAEGVLWIGTYGAGLHCLRDETIFHFGPETGLSANAISYITEDPEGHLWMTDNDGIFSAPRRQLDAFARGAVAPIDIIHLTEDDGMIVRECNGGSQPAGLLTSGGDFVVATINGIAVVRTRKSYPNPISPPAYIEGFYVGGKEMPAGAEIVLPPTFRNLEIRYAALSFSSQ